MSKQGKYFDISTEKVLLEPIPEMQINKFSSLDEDRIYVIDRYNY